MMSRKDAAGLVVLWLLAAALTVALWVMCLNDPVAAGVLGGLAAVAAVTLIATAAWAAWELAWSRFGRSTAER